MTRAPLLIAVVLLSAGACALSTHGTETEGNTTVSGGSGGQASSSSSSHGSSGTTSSSGAISSSSTTSSSSSSGVLTESDCLNGVDDDGDGLVDCDDPDCTSLGYGCLAAAPDMMAQLVLPGGACPAGSVSKTLRTCDDAGCTCTASAGQCDLSLARWDGGNCNGMPSSSVKTQPACYTTPSTVDSAFKATATSKQDTACAAGPNIASGDPGACEIKGGSCKGGGICVPPAFLTTNVCILLPPDAKCPIPYPHNSIVYDSAADSCTCSCSKTGEACDVGTIQIFNAGMCGGQMTTTAPIDGQCHSVGGAASYNFQPISSHAQCSAPTASIPAGTGTLCCSQASPN